MMEMIEKDRQGMVLRIERSSIHDGDGFRTVVFLKGCPLRCQWCSTPESQSFKIEETAENTYGTVMTVDDVMREVRKDSMFFFISGGGMTLSGGEILAQPEFSLALLKNARRECIDTAVETAFYGPWKNIAAMLPYINTVYADVKLFDSSAAFTTTQFSKTFSRRTRRRAISAWWSGFPSSRASTTAGRSLRESASLAED